MTGRIDARPLSALMPVACAGLVASLPLYFIVIEKVDVEKPKTLTAAYLTMWVIVALLGLKGRRSSLAGRPLVLWSYLTFLAIYYVNWTMWPKGTELDELMWAYSIGYAVIPFVLGTMLQPRDMRLFWTVVGALSLGLSAMVLISYVEGSETAGGRFTVATALNPVSQSLVVGYVVVILCAKLLADRQLWPIAAATPVLFLIGLGGSRGPVIALVAGTVAMSAAGRLSWKSLVAAIVVLAAIPFLGGNLPQEVRERYLASDDISIAERLVAYRVWNRQQRDRLRRAGREARTSP